MTTRQIEDRVRRLTWPVPSPGLRARVMTDAASREAGGPDVRHSRWTPTTDPGRPPRPAWRLVPVLCVVAVLIVVGACTGFDLWVGREANSEVARLEAKYGSLDEASMLPPAVPDADNRARAIWDAAALAVPLPGVKYHYIRRPVPFPVPAGLRAFADANRDAIRVVSDIRTRRQSNWGLDYRNLGDLRPGNAIRIVSDALYVTCLLDLEAGRADDAAQMIVLGLGISASVRQEPLFGPMLSGASGPFDAIRQLVTASAPSAAALQDLAWWLAENRTPDSMQAYMLAEMKLTNALFMRMENGDIDPGIVDDIYPMTWPDWPSVFVKPAALVGRPFVRMARVRYLRHMERLLDVEMGPRPRQALAEPEAPRRWALVDRLVDKFTVGTWNHSDVGDDFASELGATELAVALRRFKLDRGAYPADLSALVPTYLGRVPIDPYTGQPPVYERQGAGFTLRAKGSMPEMVGWRALDWNVAR